MGTKGGAEIQGDLMRGWRFLTPCWVTELGARLGDSSSPMTRFGATQSELNR